MLLRFLSGCVVLLLSASLSAQFATFPSKTYFREQWARPPLDVEIELAGNLENYVVDGKLQLSLRAYLEIVMSNNPDVSLQKLSVYEGQNAIQRALSPFDPNLTGTFDARRSATPSNDVLQGADVRSALNQTARFTYSESLITGTDYQVGYVGSKLSNNSAFTTFNPSINQSLEFRISQQLLRGRGKGIQRIPILIAESRLDQTEAQVRSQIMNLIFQAEQDYWSVVSARDQLRVQENSLELAGRALERSRRELELGAISPLDIYQPEERYARAQVLVTQAVYRLKQNEDAVRRQAAADLHPTVRQLPLVLTEAADPPIVTPVYDPEETVNRALRLRPEIEQRLRSIEIDDLDIRGTTDQLRPELTVSGAYSAVGRGGNFSDRSLTGGGSGTIVPGGVGDALNQLFDFSFPTYTFGLTLQLPLANRRAAADLADATIQKKRDLYQLRSLEQQVRLEILQAIAEVESSDAAVKQATIAADFAQKRLDAEQQKYDLGVTTIFFVLDAQESLVVAEAAVVSQSIAYRRALLTLLRATGDLFEARGVSVRYD